MNLLSNKERLLIVVIFFSLLKFNYSAFIQPPPNFPKFEPCTLEVGSVCGKYRLIERIGQGLVGQIFRAKSIETDNRYILKAVDKCSGYSTATDNEINILNSLNHPAIHHVEEQFQTNMFKFIVFQNDDAISLTQYSKEHDISIDEIQLIGGKLLLLIDYLRFKNIVHADIKPDNILVYKDARLGLIDFGSARKFTFDGQRFTKVVSTRYFCAPEIYDEYFGTFSTKVDYYSVGTCMAGLAMKSVPVYSEMVRHPIFKKDNRYRLLLDLAVELTALNEKDRLMDSDKIKKHPFFTGVDWEKLERSLTSSQIQNTEEYSKPNKEQIKVS